MELVLFCPPIRKGGKSLTIMRVHDDDDDDGGVGDDDDDDNDDDLAPM